MKKIRDPFVNGEIRASLNDEGYVDLQCVE